MKKKYKNDFNTLILNINYTLAKKYSSVLKTFVASACFNDLLTNENIVYQNVTRLALENI
jgi:hypothetical protein